ncbi:F-box/kelch-repeat protein At3g23880-like [Lycium ferocissimum]|uniref:F-box/kelch-repeat protein At3g23880-like n=1 Tax=Lycium ferocissimum TaxID=112874 RepID=UPI002815C3DF|nr:F-box/kelch-repeat protein At3g23880-like [Lycium ferocissimum]
MELEADEATNHTQIPSTSSKDSILANPTLPQELITAILVRLPVKYLLKFKCVSKHWFALISSPEFVKTHLSFSAKHSTHHRLVLKSVKRHTLEYNLKLCSVSSLFYEPVTEAFDLDYPMKDPQKFFRIVSSVNGLICYCIGFNDLVLWNPSTRKFKKVPDLVHTQTDDYHFSYGFGYDEVHDDYKVVAIFREISKRKYDAKIYSLKSDSWRTLDDFQGKILFNEYSSGKLVNGKLHWVTTGGDDRVITSIDLVDEKCRKVMEPYYGEESLYLTLGVLESDFSVVLSNHERMDVWVMKEYGVKESWTKLYTIIKCPGCATSPPICMSIEGEILHTFGSTLTILKPENDTMRFPKVTNIDGHVGEKLYIESLVCPISQNEPMSQH